METCIVGCRLPHGLNVDLLVKKGDKKRGIPDETQRLVIKGANSARIMGGHGITTGVPKEAFTKWLASKASLAYVRNGSVWVVDNAASARSVAAERKGERTGFEGIDPLKSKGISPEDAKVLERQRAENPARGRQVDELESPAIA
jgi:hypothetical protein